MQNEQLTAENLIVQNEALSREIRYFRFSAAIYLVASTLVVYFWFVGFAMNVSTEFGGAYRPFFALPVILNNLLWLYMSLLSFQRGLFGPRRSEYMDRVRREEADLFRQHERRQYVLFRQRRMHDLMLMCSAAQFVVMGVLACLTII